MTQVDQHQVRSSLHGFTCVECGVELPAINDFSMQPCPAGNHSYDPTAEFLIQCREEKRMVYGVLDRSVERYDQLLETHDQFLAEARAHVERIREFNLAGMRGDRLMGFNRALGDLLELIDLGEPSDQEEK